MESPWKYPYLLIGLTLYLMMQLGCTPSEPVKIGFVAALSGRRSQLGVSARNGTQLAVDMINQEGGINGRKLSLIIRDNKGEPEACARVVNELIERDVVAIIGPPMSKMADTVIKTIADKNILVISPTISTDAVKDRDDNFMRIMPVASLEAEKIVKAVLGKGHRRVAVVYDSSNRAYTEPIYRVFRAQMEAAGTQITYVNSMAEGNGGELLAVAKTIVDSGAEVLFIVTSGIDAALLCQQIRKFDPDIQLYGAHWVKTGNVIEEGGRSVEGLTLVVPFERQQKTPEYMRFQQMHQDNFKSKPGFVSVYAYEAMQVLATGMRKSQDLNSTSIKRAIIETRTFQGLEEVFTINRFGDAIRTDSLITVRNGKFVRVSE